MFYKPLEAIYHNWSYMKAVKSVYIKFILNDVMFMLNSNEPIKSAHLQRLTNQSMLNGALVVEMVNNSFSES